jgi:hypothetical protein
MSEDRESNGREHTPRSVQMPAASPQETLSVVEELAQLAGPASRQRLASRMNVSNTGWFASRVGAAITYGFFATENDKLVVTPRGEALLAEDDQAVSAMRQAVMSCGFASVISRLATRRADIEVVALRMEEDLGLKPAPALKRAKVLVKAAEEAQLVSGDKFDAGAIEDAIAEVGEIPLPEPRQAPKREVKPRVAAEKPPAPTKPTENAPAARRQEAGSAPLGGAAPLQVTLQIDASKLSAQEIGKLIEQLRQPASA